MHEIVYFARQNASRVMRVEACPADGSRTVPAVPGSCSDRPCCGTASSGIVLLTFLRVVLLSFATQSLQIAWNWYTFFANVLARISIVFCN